MRLYRVSDASNRIEVKARKPTEGKFGSLMVKSPRKTRSAAIVSLVVMALGIAFLVPLGAQEPPSAPTPKAKPDSQIPSPPAQSTAPAQNTVSQPAAAAPNSDSLVILKARSNLVVLP